MEKFNYFTESCISSYFSHCLSFVKFLIRFTRFDCVSLLILIADLRNKSLIVHYIDTVCPEFV